MRSLFVALCVVLCISTCMAIVFERPEHQPKGWQRASRPTGDHPIRLQIALKQQNMKQLEEILYRIADPREPTYSQWLSLDELTQLVAPSPADLQRVISWLESNGYVVF